MRKELINLDKNDINDIIPKLKSLLSNAFICIKTMLKVEGPTKEGFEQLAKNAREIDGMDSCDKVRKQYKDLLSELDKINAPPDATNENETCPARDYRLSGAEEFEFSRDINSAFARGTRRLYEQEEDTFHGLLLKLEEKKFDLNQKNVFIANNLINNFLYAKSNESQIVTKEREELKIIIHTLSETLLSLSSQNTTYNSSLKDYALKINNAVELEDIIKIKKVILKETKEIFKESEKFKAKSAHFEEKLKNAGKKISSLEKELEKVKEKSSIDPLTKVLNRGYFNIKIRETVNEFERYAEKTCFVMLDIDHFKRFNDDFGHQVGDKVLEMVAQLVKEDIRKTDLFFSLWRGGIFDYFA